MKETDEVGTSVKNKCQQTRNCGFVTYSHNVQILSQVLPDYFYVKKAKGETPFLI